MFRLSKQRANRASRRKPEKFIVRARRVETPEDGELQETQAGFALSVRTPWIGLRLRKQTSKG